MKIYNYYKYSEKISCAGLPKEEEFVDIKKAGFEIVLSLSMPSDSVVLENEDKILANLGIPYFHIPVDANAPTLRDFEMFVQFLEAFKENKLFIHCTKNHRLSSFIYLYHFVKEGELKEEILYQFYQPRTEWVTFIEIVLKKYKREKYATKNS